MVAPAFLVCDPYDDPEPQRLLARWAAYGMNFLGLHPRDFYCGWPVPNDLAREYFRFPALTFPLLGRLLPAGFKLRIFDGLFDQRPMEQYRDLIRWADVVGCSITSEVATINHGVAIAQIKRLNPRAVIIIGGHYASLYPHRFLDLGADVIVKREAEPIFADLMREIAGARHFDRIPGIIFRQDGETVETEEGPLLEHLDESPIPDWDAIDFSLYPSMHNRRESVGSLECSRGCSHRCSFCLVPVYWKGRQRYKSIGRVIEEVKQLTARNIRALHIVDDGFGNDLDYTAELATALQRLPDELFIYSFIRPDLGLERPELIEQLARAGLKIALVGFEALNRRVLRRHMHKGFRGDDSLQARQEVYRLFRKNGIMVAGFFVSGHPDLHGTYHTSYLDARTVCDDPRAQDFRPYLGTPGYRQLAGRHQIRDLFVSDTKVPIFEQKGRETFWFNLMNLLDLPRSARMLLGPAHYRNFFLRSNYALWRNVFTIDRRKLLDFLLLKSSDLSSADKLERLQQRYFSNPAYEHWIDSAEGKV